MLATTLCLISAAGPSALYGGLTVSTLQGMQVLLQGMQVLQTGHIFCEGVAHGDSAVFLYFQDNVIDAFSLHVGARVRGHTLQPLQLMMLCFPGSLFALSGCPAGCHAALPPQDGL